MKGDRVKSSEYMLKSDKAKPASTDSEHRPKVGIVTFIKNANYGSVLQAYALQETLREKGYDAYIIDYMDMALEHNVQTRRVVIRSRLLGSLRAPLRSFKLQGAKGAVAPSDEKAAVFHDFETLHMKFSKEDYTRRDSFDAFVCGSDQIWSLATPGLNWRFFLRFAPKDKRVAYAPSFGMEEVPSFNKNRLRRYLSGISHISVRESSGSEIIRKVTGQKASVVLDPVLLAGADFWRDERIFEKRQHLVCYFVSDASGALAYIEKIADREGLKVIWLQDIAVGYSDWKSVTPTPFEFVRLIGEAAYVCTDSFHGMVFAILFGIDFSVFDRNYEVNNQQVTRIDSLLELVGLSPTRDGGRRDVCNYDTRAVNESLEKMRVSSYEYLIDALDEAVGSDD